MRRAILSILAAGLLLLGCTSGSDDSSSDDTSSNGTAGDTTDQTFESGPAPGVTDDSIKVGVTYVDLASLGDIIDIDHGDYEEKYSALFDHINDEGGINGRTIDYTIVPVSPSGTQPADDACAQLTQDEESFLIMGFFLGDTVLCPVETHSTAVIGGVLTPERQARAQAPWYSNELSSDSQLTAIRAMAEAGDLDGTVGVFGGPEEESLMNDTVLPELDELGVDVAESAIVDQTAEDVAATDNSTEVIAERFDASGVDQVLVLGTSSLAFVQGIAPTDFRPAIRFTEAGAIQTYAGGDGRDVTPLEGSVLGTGYGPARAIYELPAMQDCFQILADAGIDIPEPPETGLPDDAPWTSAFTACQQVVLFQSLVEAAGDDLNYGSLAGASEGLQVDMPQWPDPLTYGTGEHADGDPPSFLFDWDADLKDFVPREDS